MKCSDGFYLLYKQFVGIFNEIKIYLVYYNLDTVEQ